MFVNFIDSYLNKKYKNVKLKKNKEKIYFSIFSILLKQNNKITKKKKNETKTHLNNNNDNDNLKLIVNKESSILRAKFAFIFRREQFHVNINPF